MPLPIANPRRIPRAMSAEPEAMSDPTWGENNIATVPPVIALASDMNTWAHQVSDSIRYVRETAMMVSDFQAAQSGFPSNSALFGVGLRWANGLGLNKPTDGDIFLCNGKRLDLFTQSILDIAGITNHTFPPNTRVWVYASGTYLDRLSQVGGQGTTLPASPPLSVDLYFHDVGAGNPPVVPAGYFIVGGVNTNGTGITSNFTPATFPAPFNLQSGIVFDSINMYFNGTVEIGSSLIVQGSGTFSDEVNINSSLNVQDTAHFFGDVIIDGLVTASNIEISGGATFNGVEVNDLVVFNSFIVDIAATSTFQSPVSMTSTLEVDGFVTCNSNLATYGTLEVNGPLDCQGSASFVNTVSFETSSAIVFQPRNTPGAPVDGQVWVKNNPSTGLYFQDNASVVQKTWATPLGLVPRQATVAGPINIPTGAFGTLISENISILVGTSVFIVAKAAISLQDGDGVESNRVSLRITRDGANVETTTYFLGSHADNTSDNALVVWTWCGYIDGPCTVLAVEGFTVINNGNIGKATALKLAIIGTIPTSSIL